MKEIITNQSCNHCGVNRARYISVTNKLCCENNVAKCPAIKALIGNKNKKNLSEVDQSTGLSKAKTLATARKTHAENNSLDDPYKIAAEKMVTTRRDSGSYDSVNHSDKILATKRIVGEDGLTVLQKSTSQMVLTRNKIGADNLSSFERAANKSATTRLHDIDEQGRNGFDRMWIKAGQAKPYTNTPLYYRSLLEKLFLDKLTKLKSLDWVIENVINPSSIEYTVDGRVRKYIPDFIIGNNLYEIKSSYTWDDFGKNIEWRKKNIAKLNSATDRGFTVILVLNEIEYYWTEYRKQYDTLE